MEADFISATMLNLGINLLYTIITLFVCLAALLVIDKKLLKGISLEEEMKKGNMAVAVFASTILMFVALIVTFGFKG